MENCTNVVICNLNINHLHRKSFLFYTKEKVIYSYEGLSYLVSYLYLKYLIIKLVNFLLSRRITFVAIMIDSKSHFVSFNIIKVPATFKNKLY